MAGYSLLEIVSPSLLASQPSLTARCGLRIVTAWVLAYLWCVAFPVTPTSAHLRVLTGSWIIALVVAVLIPVLDTTQRIERYVANASVAKQGNRLDLATETLQRLLELHPQATVDGVAATAMFLDTMDQIQRTEKWLDSKSTRMMDGKETLDRCAALLTLGRTEEASRLVQSLQAPSPTATTFMILIAKQREDWASMASLCRAALNQPIDESHREHRRNWIELMGESMGRLGNRKEAAEWYQKGMDESPSDRTLFELKLAIELGEQGRLGQAVSILESVAREHPEYEAQIAPHLRRFKNHHCLP
jgi:tetratricopeptide (TPR) repeat protein